MLGKTAMAYFTTLQAMNLRANASGVVQQFPVGRDTVVATISFTTPGITGGMMQGSGAGKDTKPFVLIVGRVVKRLLNTTSTFIT